MKIFKKLAAAGAAIMMAVTGMAVNVSAAYQGNWNLRYTYGAPTGDNNQTDFLYVYYPFLNGVTRAKCSSITSSARVTVSSPDNYYPSVSFVQATSMGNGKKLAYTNGPGAGNNVTHQVTISATAGGTYYSTGLIRNYYA